MTQQSNRPAAAQTIIILGALGVWCASAIVAGAMNLAHDWGIACLVAGGLAATALIVGIVLKSWLAALYGVLAITGAGTIAAGLVMDDGSALIGAGLLGLLVVGSALPIALHLKLQEAPSSATPTARTDELLAQILETAMLSDHAKRVLFRERELGLLRKAIDQAISRGDYDAAITLCDEMANQFGYREEAETFRSSIDQARDEHYDAQLDTALTRLDALLTSRDWSAAHQEAARIRRLYPDSHIIDDLDGRIMRARAEHKQELEARFLELAQRDDVEAAMHTLKELDRYLSREEAERLAEVAQGVIVRHRENLGVQFKLAVNDHRWGEAARLGDTIISEFPNTQMAAEVRSMIDVLRTRATQAALAAQVK